jgi:hypothetical protein
VERRGRRSTKGAVTVRSVAAAAGAVGAVHGLVPLALVGLLPGGPETHAARHRETLAALGPAVAGRPVTPGTAPAAGAS